jgi:outer membrane autotransporter protein
MDASFQPSNPFVATPQNQNPDTWAGGVWSRVGGGDMTVKSTATDSLGSPSAAIRVKTTFDAFEVGVDTGRLNIGESGWNGHFGVMGGDMTANSTEQLTGTSTRTDLPFAGVYGVLVKGPWFVNLAARYDWLNANVTDAAANLSNAAMDGHNVNITGGAGYHILLANQWFVEPSAGFSWSQTDLGTFATNLGQAAQGIAAGSLSYGTLDTTLVHGGVRVGTTVPVADNLILQPYGTLSAWHEFGDNLNATFAQQGGLADVISLNRVGTFYQGGIGVTGQIPNTAFTGFVRGDFQFGDRVDGSSVVGGLRYNFAPTP